MKRHQWSYDNPLVLTWEFIAQDFGGGANITHILPVPKHKPEIGTARGMGGRVMGVFIYQITEDFAGSSSDAGVQVGRAGALTRYFNSGLVLDESVDIGESQEILDNGSQVDIEDNRSDITLTLVANVGTPTGIASVKVVTAWWGGTTI